MATASASYPLKRKREDPDFATQSHQDQMDALVSAMREVLAKAGISGEQVEAIALDTTGSSVVPVDAALQPLDDYYLWCDHRAKGEAQEITELAHSEHLEAIEWCGGVYSHEWGFAKLLHWLRHNPEKRGRLASAFEHCDMVAATLSGITDPKLVKRSICAMGHKWMWNPKWDGLPSQAFLSGVDPLLDGIREKLAGEYHTSDKPGGPPCAGVGGEDGFAGGYSDSRRRLRCPLGCHRCRVQAGRCGQRSRDFDLHHGDAAEDHADPGRLRGGSGQRAPWLYRH